MTHGAAVNQSLDVGAALVAQHLLIGPPQAQRLAVAVLGAALGPSHRAVAVVREGLVGLDAQEAEEAQLDHAHRPPAGVHIGELGGRAAWRAEVREGGRRSRGASLQRLLTLLPVEN